jgi:uncharacterized protein
MPCFFIVVNIIESFFFNDLIKIFYTISGLYLGLIFISFFFMLFLNLIFYIIKFISNKFKSRKIKTYFKKLIINKGIIIISIISIIFVYSFINSFIIKTNYIEIKSDKIDEKLKIVLITDLHLGPVYDIYYLDKILNKVDKINPDILLISGDFLDGSGHYNYNIKDSFENRTYPIYLSIGNHEIYSGIDYISEIFDDVNIILLRDELIKYNNIQIIGIDDSENKNQVKKVLEKIDIDQSNYSILLYHKPQGFDDAINNNIGLMLSGHTHNGQIFPFHLLVKIAFPYIYGLYEKDNSFLYVSSGIGTWGPKLRFLSNNEIVVINIIPIN